MSEELFALNKLQGELRIVFMKLGLDELTSHNLSSEALHIFATSQIAKSEYRQSYAELQTEVEEIRSLFDEGT